MEVIIKHGIDVYFGNNKVDFDQPENKLLYSIMTAVNTFKLDLQNYYTAKKAAENKLKGWETVYKEIDKLITIPSTKKQYDIMLSDPLNYVAKALDDLHRPNFNKLPISTEKLLELRKSMLSR